MPSGYEVTTHGGRKRTNIDVLHWAKKGVKNGAGEILLTSMNLDGTKKGYNLGLTKLISKNVEVPVIASGGAGNPKDMVEVILKAGASAVLAASIFHYGIHSIDSVKKEMLKNGIIVRDCEKMNEEIIKKLFLVLQDRKRLVKKIIHFFYLKSRFISKKNR